MMIDRRRLLKIGSAASVFGLGVIRTAHAAESTTSPIQFSRDQIPNLPEVFTNPFDEAEPEIRRVRLYNLHTGESADVVYKEGGEVIQDALSHVNSVLRDFRNDQIKEMDVALLDMLDKLSRKLEINTPFNVISGYRSPQTNAMLSARSDGVAKGSLHMQGKAIDIRVPGVALSHLRNVAKSMQIGGVGYYASSNFVHVDTGRVRYW